jgi:phosphomannomutase / phosphoglucomutase
MQKLYEKLGYNSIMVNGVEDGMFPGRGSAPTKESLQEAAEYVVRSKADYGVGFDADADRGLIIDDKGRIVPPEKIAIIIARHRYGCGDLVIGGLDCSMILERELEPEGIKVERERVGDVYIANRVKDSGAVIGVERSAHFFIPEFQYGDDPFAMSLALGEIISEGLRLSDLSDMIPDYPYLETKIVLDKEPTVVMNILEERLAPQNPDKRDGLKIINERHSILIRPSNTEPIIRLYVETMDDDIKELTNKYTKIVKDAIMS